MILSRLLKSARYRVARLTNRLSSRNLARSAALPGSKKHKNKSRGRFLIFSPQETTPTSGLIRLNFALYAAKPRALTDSTLELQINDQQHKCLHRETLSADNLQTEQWLAINSHLLANGSTQLYFLLLADKEPQFCNSVELNIDNTGPLAEKVRASLGSYNSPIVISKDCHSGLFNFGDESLKPWFDRSNATEILKAKAEQSAFVKQHQKPMQQLLDDGYMTISGWLDDAFIEQLNTEIDDAVTKKLQGYEPGSSQRLMGLHQHYSGIKQLWEHPKVLEMLGHVFDDEARPCQTLSYVFGSQQSYHQDTVHLTPFPQGYMCGVWVALEDIKVGSGELRVLKGSHRLPRIYRETANCPQVIDNQWDEFALTVDKRWQQMIEENNFEEESYLAKKGDLLIWHENLMHGGSLRENLEQSRRSIVSHYFAKGALGFYDSSGLPAILG